MAGYDRQSAADIVPTAVVRSGPVNNELNALRDAFIVATGHKHDGTATEGALIPLIGDADSKNKVVIDTNNNRVGMFVEVATVSTEQVRVQDGAIVPVTDDDIDLGTGSLEFRNLYLDGTATIDSIVADTADINGGTIDNVVIGSANAEAITGTLITATTGFSGPITGAVTGNVTGNLTGNVTGNVTGNLTGNVTAASGTSTFNNVTIAGTLDMDGATAATIINLASPTNTNDAATKGYVDTADALKLNLSGGTMSGAIAMGTNKITGLGTPTDTADAATKGYVDTQVSNLIDAAPGALDTLNELAAALGDDANFSTTVTNSLATKLNLSGGTMTGAIAMGTNKITGMGDPTSNQDAATKKYVDDGLNLKLNLSGGTMSGAIAMGTSKITGLGDPSSTQDAATKNYVDTQDATKLSLSGGTMTGAIAMGTSKITGLGDPTGNQDAVTKIYIDTLFGSTTSAAASAAAASVSASNAANSEANALTYSNNASSSASAAATSANNAATSYDDFDDRYLGSKSSPPSLDNDGNALLTGALYWNSVGNQLFVWDGAAWDQAAFNTSGALLTGDIGVTVQAYDAGLQSISGLTTAADKMIYTTALDTYAVTDLTAAGRAILDDADAAAQRTTLGLAIGTNVQAYDAGLQSISGLTTAADKMIYTTALDTYAVTDLTAAGRAILDDADAAAQRTTLGLAIGTNVQAYDAGLQSIAGLTTVADRMIYTTASDVYAVTTLTAAGRAILDDVDAAAQRTTLGLTALATTTPGTNVTTFLTTPSSANLAAAVTDETGSGSLVFATSPTLVTPVLGTPTSGTLSNCTVDGTDAVGFRNTPINSQSAAYTLVLTDAGKTILHPDSDNNARTFTIPANGSVAYPVGTVITFVNMKNTVTIAITTDTMYLAGDGTTGSRTLAEYGVASAVKVASTTWIVSGNGLT